MGDKWKSTVDDNGASGGVFRGFLIVMGLRGMPLRMF